MSEEQAPKQKPDFILSHERQGKDGRIYRTELAALFSREDGTHRGKLVTTPVDGWVTLHSPQERLSASKESKKKIKERSDDGHEP